MPLFRLLVRADMPGVCFEVITAAGHLMERRLRLSATAWDAVFGIFRTAHDRTGLLELQGPLQQAVAAVAEWADALCQAGTFYGDVEQLYAFLQRSGSSVHVLRALEYHELRMRPDTPNWIVNVDRFLTTYFSRAEAALETRLHALEAIGRLLQDTCDVYASDLVITGPVGRHLANIHEQPELDVQRALLNLWTRIGLFSPALAVVTLHVLEQWFDAVCLSTPAGPADDVRREREGRERDRYASPLQSPGDGDADTGPASRGATGTRGGAERRLHTSVTSSPLEDEARKWPAQWWPEVEALYVRCLSGLLVTCMQQPSTAATVHCLRLLVQVADHALRSKTGLDFVDGRSCLALRRGG